MSVSSPKTDDKKIPLASYSVKVRPRYSETDQMGYVYHGRFVEYFEMARTEMVREAGFSYDKLEKMGVMMPIIDLSLKFNEPAFYDEELTVTVSIFEKPGIRLRTHYEIRNSEGKLNNTGSVTLCFVDKETRRPVRPPQEFIDGMLKVNKS